MGRLRQHHVTSLALFVLIASVTAFALSTSTSASAPASASRSRSAPGASPQRTDAGAPARIEGIVVDESGAPLPGVQVVLLMRDRQIGTITADVNGKFTFAGLAPDAYTVIATLTGFTTATQQIAVLAGRTATVTLTLRVSGVAETVTVSSGGAPLQASMSRVRGSRPRHESTDSASRP